ncbi:MAG: TetR family transcriptional regulator [Anaerolineae bacterium]|nr:TetR family transcriptional regulator [Anaerolineae bacterium]
MRKTKEEALITRENLLSAALRVFSQKGYSATRLDDIAQAAGVTRGAIYHHFGGKEELFMALVSEREAGVNKIAQQIVAEGGSASLVLRRLLVRLFEYLEEDKQYRALLTLAVNKLEFSEGLESFADQMIQGRRSLISFLEGLVAKGIEAGEFRKTLSPRTTALALSGYLNGMALIWIQDPKNFSIAGRAEGLVDVLMGGLSY